MWRANVTKVTLLYNECMNRRNLKIGWCCEIFRNLLVFLGWDIDWPCWRRGLTKILSLTLEIISTTYLQTFVRSLTKNEFKLTVNLNLRTLCHRTCATVNCRKLRPSALLRRRLGRREWPGIWFTSHPLHVQLTEDFLLIQPNRKTSSLT